MYYSEMEEFLYNIYGCMINENELCEINYS